MATSGALRAVLLLFLGLIGTDAAWPSVQISVGGEDVTDTAYFAQIGESVTFTCKGGSNATWTVSSLAVPHSDQGNGLYQSSNNEGGQLLRVLSFNMEQVARYTCKANNLSQAYVELEADIISNVTVLNSTAVTVYWSTKPKIGIVQCCPDGKLCLTATVKDTDLDNYVYSGLEEYTRYAVSLRGESRKVFIVTYQDRPSAEPLNIRFFIESSLHITISWELPVAEDRNGIITSYILNCIVTGSTEIIIINETVHVEKPRFDSPSEQSYRIRAKHHSTYVCWVSAATVNGSGPASMHSNVTVELPKLAISNNGDDSVVASWDIPHVSGVSSVQSSVSLIYNVLATGGVKTNISVPAAKTEWTISNLVAGVPYEVKVELEVGVFNIITESETKVFFTRELEPLQAVKELSAIAINGTAIQANWTELSLNKARGYPVYTIHIESKAISWSNEVSAQSIPAIVNGLLPATQYTVWVKVTTAGSTGVGRISSSVSVETKSEGRSTVGPTDGTAPIAVGLGVGMAVIISVVAVVVVVGVMACLCILWRSLRGKPYRDQYQEGGQVLYETGNGTPMSSPPAPVQAIPMDLLMHNNPVHESLEVAYQNQAQAPSQTASAEEASDCANV